MPYAYYNEHEPYAAQWLRNLIAAGHIADGAVDERSILEVSPDDLEHFDQCHFFAGIGGWSLALRMAGVPDDLPVWTGSCPCQPFSAAGKQKGTDDDRHLWPAFFKLIDARRPGVIFGEQVASPAGLAWLDAVSADLKGAAYTFGAADLCAASVGAPHIRQRLWFVGLANEHLEHAQRDGEAQPWAGGQTQSGHDAGGRGGLRGLADVRGAGGGRDGGAVPCAQGEGQGQREGAGDLADEPLADGADALGLARPGPTNGFWGAADWLLCRDGRWRPVEPGSFPLAHGVPSRVGKLRAYGNAIVSQVAAEFVKAVLACRP